MNLFVDLDLGLVVATPGYVSPLSGLTVRRGDQPTVTVKFLRDGVVIDPGMSASEVSLVVKTAGNYAQDPALVAITSWTKSGSGATTAWSAVADFDTAAVAALVGDAASAAAQLQVRWTLSSKHVSAKVVDLTVENAVNRVGDVAGPGVAGSTGVDASITTEAQLAAIVTTNLTVPAIKVWVLDADLTVQIWVLKAGTDASVSGSVRRPDDYNASTNAKVWYRAG